MCRACLNSLGVIITIVKVECVAIAFLKAEFSNPFIAESLASVYVDVAVAVEVIAMLFRLRFRPETILRLGVVCGKGVPLFHFLISISGGLHCPSMTKV